MSARRLLLQPLTPLYQAATWADRWMKQRGALRSRLPVISVGNISSGGTGKTQLVAWLARLLQVHSPVLVLSRGYGRLSAEDVVLRPGENALDPAFVGDEPALLLADLHRGGVGVAHNRARLLRRLESADSEFRDAIVILDDGFQHWRIERDFDIVLVDDATVDGCLIPAGDLRERHSALRRADLLIATSDRAEEFLLNKHEPSRVVRLRQSSVRFLTQEGERTPSELGAVVAVAGIARPERFVQTLRDANVEVVDMLLFGDHVRYQEREISAIIARLDRLNARFVVTTSKDAVKLSRVPELAGRLCVAEVGVEVDRAGEVLAAIDAVVRRIRGGDMGEGSQ